MPNLEVVCPIVEFRSVMQKHAQSLGYDFYGSSKDEELILLLGYDKSAGWFDEHEPHTKVLTLEEFFALKKKEPDVIISEGREVTFGDKYIETKEGFISYENFETLKEMVNKLPHFDYEISVCEHEDYIKVGCQRFTFRDLDEVWHKYLSYKEELKGAKQ